MAVGKSGKAIAAGTEDRADLVVGSENPLRLAWRLELAHEHFLLPCWLDRDMNWLAPKAGKPGRPPVFSDAAILFCLMIKVLFGLPLRQTTGMVASILEMAGLDWPVPDFSTLSRRQKTIAVQLSSRRAPGPLNLLVDSTGIKFLGDGEGLARKHGTHRRR